MKPEGSQDEMVVLSEVTKQFNGADVVRGLSLHVPRGQVFGLLGPNGAGKTTTLRMLLGILRPDGGTARVLGLDPQTEAVVVKQRVGYVPEGHYTHRWMRVAEAVRFCAAFYPTWNDWRCTELLERFRLDPHKKVKHLSKGMLTKLSLMLALSHDPELLILDEPTSGLDPIVREELLDCVLGVVCDAAPTVLISSHILADVQRIADRVGILCDGRLVVDQPLDELLQRTKRVRVVVRDGVEQPAAPSGTVFQRRKGREWVLTVCNFVAEAVKPLYSDERVETVTVFDVGLEEIFKDVVKGRTGGETIQEAAA